MEPTDVRPRTVGALAVRSVLSLLALPVLGYWLLASFYLLVIRCGDTCSGQTDVSGRWEYTGQFVLAAPCILAGLVGLVLGFTPARALSRQLVQVACAGGIIWFVFVYWSLVIAAP